MSASLTSAEPPGAAVAEVEGEIERRDIEPEKAADRPGAECQKKHTSGKADEAEQQHQEMKRRQRQAAMRQQHSFEKDPVTGVFRPVVSV